ncbi:hypothetical protein RvY_10608 [Ramazzottius varieornatus]|uniref:Uncharacterized protein n=1 Tax=Ramazzottius varieornatus TaxID=947166 RepID=A0A1D1VFE3_RAMVA|nr:hypothetical protein RvY_10608 [Ramazzottius varieornatus]
MSFNINATNIYLRKGPENVFNRVQQWATFARQWWLFDAKNQDPFQTAYHIRPYLNGKTKPLFSPQTDCGDHVVIVNSKHIALEGDLWERIEFYHNTGLVL